jgi:hypothetical protein
LAIQRIVVECADFKSVKIENLEVTRLRVSEVTVRTSLVLPAGNLDPNFSS